MTVLVDRAGGVVTVTLHRPEVRNAYGGSMPTDLQAALDQAAADDDVRVIVLTGTPPAFCAGADLARGDATFDQPTGSAFSAAGLRTPLWQIPKLVIAAVNGHAVGIGLTLALQADVRLFAADAKYGVVQVRRGVMGDAYSHWTLPRLVGSAAAADILLTGRIFDGGEAQRLGLCSQVFANDEVLPAAQALAQDVAVNAAPLSIAHSKRLLWDSWELSAADVGERETAAHHELMGAPDAIEGMRAYLERRAPDWQGRTSAL